MNNLPKYFIFSQSGDYSLGVNTEVEMLFAATGDRLAYLTCSDSFGTPSVIEDFFESASELGSTWNSLYEWLEEETIKEYIEYSLPAYELIDGELVSVEHKVIQYLEGLL